MSKRAELEAVGLKVFHANVGKGGEGCGEAVIKAVAAMLLAAPAAQSKRKPAEGPTLPFSPQAMHQALLARVAHVVSMELVSGSIFGRLGAKLKSIPGLEAADLERLVAWIEAGAMSGWPVQPTFQMVCNNCDKYFTLAREWDRRGRQPLRRGSNAVGSVEGANFDSGAFK